MMKKLMIAMTKCSALTMLGCLAALTMWAEPANATIVVANGSFDAQAGSITGLGGTQFGQAFGSLTGWTATITTGDLRLANGDAAGPPYYAGNGGNIPFTYANDGATYLLFGGDDYTLTQVISGLLPGPVDVSFDLLRLRATSNAGATRAQVELFDGVDDTATVLYDSGTINVELLAQETWTSFTSGALSNTGSNMFVRITLFDNATSALGGIDNLVVNGTFPIPEPSTFVLAVLALGGLCVRRRRRS